MNKQTSQSLKGIAILFMLFLHLFNQEYNVTLTDPFLYIGNKPLVSLLAMFTNLCVPIYLFLSGYGLYISYNNTKNASKTPLKRIRVLYENYWSVLLLFVCIGYFVSPEKYPGNIQKVIENTIGWHTSYNGEWWFFFPYVILVGLSPFLLGIMQKYQWKYWLIGLPILHFITFTLIKLYGEWLYAHQGIYYMVLIPNCAAAFLAGSLFAKEQLFNRFIFVLNKYSLQKNYLLMLGILGLVVIRTFLPVSFFNTYLALLFMLLFVSLRRSVNVDRILNYFGSHSTNMWLTHSFFCYYLFKDFVYGFKYPIVIYGALIFLSLGSSYIINAIMYLWSLVKENIKINILPTK